jgi:hypothetical protein
VLGDASSADQGKRIEPAEVELHLVFLACLSLLIFCTACNAVSLSARPRFFLLKLLDHHCHRMDGMQHESEALRWKPFFANTK